MPFLFLPCVHKFISETKEEQLTETEKLLLQQQCKDHLPHSLDEPWGWQSWSSDCKSKWCGSCWFPAVYSPEWTSIPSCSALSNSRRNSWDYSTALSTKHKHREKNMINHTWTRAIYMTGNRILIHWNVERQFGSTRQNMTQETWLIPSLFTLH